MRSERKAARDYVQSMKTRDDLNAYIDMLNLSETERDIARMMFVNKWTRAKIALETGYSESWVKRRIERIYDRMA